MGVIAWFYKQGQAALCGDSGSAQALEEQEESFQLVNQGLGILFWWYLQCSSDKVGSRKLSSATHPEESLVFQCHLLHASDCFLT
jgi:hypothetical protein